MITCYPGVGKKKGLGICQAFADGANAAGDIARVQPPGTAATLAPGSAFFYGTTSDNEFLLKQAIREKRDWYYADNAYYFGRGRYFRVTRNALQHDGSGTADPARWRSFGLATGAWKRDGRNIVIATQSDLWHQQRTGGSRQEWAVEIRRRLKAYTDRPVDLCLKPDARDMQPNQPHSPQLEHLLRDAWCCVVHSSSAAVASLIAGVPVITLANCAATIMGVKSLAQIEDPLYPDDRERWLAVLAANQWTVDEMRDGTAWRALQAEQAHPVAAE